MKSLKRWLTASAYGEQPRQSWQQQIGGSFFLLDWTLQFALEKLHCWLVVYTKFVILFTIFYAS